MKEACVMCGGCSGEGKGLHVRVAAARPRGHKSDVYQVMYEVLKMYVKVTVGSIAESPLM